MQLSDCKAANVRLCGSLLHTAHLFIGVGLAFRLCHLRPDIIRVTGDFDYVIPIPAARAKRRAKLQQGGSICSFIIYQRGFCIAETDPLPLSVCGPHIHH